MTVEEIKVLLKRKAKEEIELASKDHGKHNQIALENWHQGRASGIEEALQILGMLDKENNRVRK